MCIAGARLKAPRVVSSDNDNVLVYVWGRERARRSELWTIFKTVGKRMK